MKVTFLGVGSAFDEEHTNISMILEAGGKNLLLDCGYSVPHALFRYNDDPDFLDAIWISHPHADHYYGLGMLIRLKTNGREKPLTILTRPDIREYIESIIALSYPGSYSDLPFDLEFVEFEEEVEWEGLSLSTAPTEHPVPNRALRVEDGESAFCYSGDGMFTDESKELYNGADLLVHESFTVEERVENHGNVRDVADLMDGLGVKKFAAVHLRSDVRRESDVEKYIDNRDEDIILPSEGDVLEF